MAQNGKNRPSFPLALGRWTTTAVIVVADMVELQEMSPPMFFIVVSWSFQLGYDFRDLKI